MLSVILPAYNEEKMIVTAAETVAEILKSNAIPYQLIFVDDGSNDNTWSLICTAAQRNRNIIGVHFSRNFGKESAMFAGLEKAKGDCCVVMDCDLQHPPEKIVEMYRLWEQGYEVVEGIKEDRGEEGNFRNFAASLFYRIISKATGLNMSEASDFKLLDRKVVDALNGIQEKIVFFRAMSYWVGFRKTTVTYCVQERVAGESKWSTSSLFKYALKNITSFSSAPMQLITALGFVVLVFSVIMGTIALYQKFVGVALSGFTTVIIIQLFCSSVIMISLGIMGYYIAKIYEECKGRPRYIISETCGEKNMDSIA